jgi:hypothetical protein
MHSGSLCLGPSTASSVRGCSLYTVQPLRHISPAGGSPLLCQQSAVALSAPEIGRTAFQVRAGTLHLHTCALVAQPPMSSMVRDQTRPATCRCRF